MREADTAQAVGDADVWRGVRKPKKAEFPSSERSARREFEVAGSTSPDWRKAFAAHAAP